MLNAKMFACFFLFETLKRFILPFIKKKRKRNLHVNIFSKKVRNELKKTLKFEKKIIY